MSDPTRIDLATDSSYRITGRTAHGNLPISVPLISEIIPGLWQGGCINGLTLPENFKHVVSLYPWERYAILHEASTELYVRAYDSIDQPFNQLDWVAHIVSELMLPRDGDILVHCQAGLNRSSFVVANVLLDYGHADPIKLLREKRSPACLCNPSFEKEIRSRMPDGD